MGGMAYAHPWQDVAGALRVDPSRGLSAAEIDQRRIDGGPNVVDRESGRSLGGIVARQFKSLIVLLLGSAAAIALFTGDTVEGAAILAVLVVNALIGAGIEWQSERALGRLRLQARVFARVIRDGKDAIIPASEVVTGDLIVLEAGSLAPADARVIEAVALEAEESALTGESLPVTKRVEPVAAGAALPDRASMVFLGSTISKGHGRAIVTAVGESTELGLIGKLVRQTAVEATPLERQLTALGRRLVQVVLAIATLVAAAGVARGEPLWPMVEFGISLAVAAVPEGLPAVTTLVLALGVLRMARRHAVVRRLPAVETLGSTTVICTDKTGTLTQNRLTVRAVESDRRVRALEIAALCNDASLPASGDPTELALLHAAEAEGIDVAGMRARHPKTGELPFDHETKRMITLHALPGGRFVAALKGAPRAVLERCEMPESERQRLLSENYALAARALRVLAVAEREVLSGEVPENGFEFRGLIGMSDPPRDGASAAIRNARAAGVRIVMITGDQPETARAIATELRLADAPRVMHARELAAADPRRVTETDVFARVSPADKLRIVDDFRRCGEVVAVTGDGVNDAPALRRADIGVAMGASGTDAARQSAALILTDDDLGTIVEAIEEGRTIRANIGKFVHLMFSHNLGEVLTVVFALLAGVPLPLLPLQILWINLVTDVLPAFALAMEPRNRAESRKPSREALLTGRFLMMIGWQGAMLAAITFAAYIHALDQYGSGPRARTVAMTALIAVQLGHLFNCRSQTRSAFEGIGRNPLLWAAVVAVAAIQWFAISTEALRRVLKLELLSGDDWVLLAVCTILPVAIVEVQKMIARSAENRSRTAVVR